MKIAAINFYGIKTSKTVVSVPSVFKPATQSKAKQMQSVYSRLGSSEVDAKDACIALTEKKSQLWCGVNFGGKEIACLEIIKPAKM